MTRELDPIGTRDLEHGCPLFGRAILSPVLLLETSRGAPTLHVHALSVVPVELAIEPFNTEYHACPFGYPVGGDHALVSSATRGLFAVYLAYPHLAHVPVVVTVSTREGRPAIPLPPQPPPASNAVFTQWLIERLEEGAAGCTSPEGCTRATLVLSGARSARIAMDTELEPAVCLPGGPEAGLNCHFPADHGGFGYHLRADRSGRYAILADGNDGLAGGSSAPRVVRRFQIPQGTRLVVPPTGLIVGQ